MMPSCSPREAESKGQPSGDNAVAFFPSARHREKAVISTLHKRADFLRAAKASRQGAPAFLLQARLRDGHEPDPDQIRIGYTCSKKLGNAVTRNRAKRRLRAAVRQVLADAGRPGWDYVLVGRPNMTATREFALICADLRRALEQVHNAPQHKSRVP